MPSTPTCDVAIIGAGIAGIATAYYLTRDTSRKVMLIDAHAPMSFTSAQSGENYRNWWPTPTMSAFVDHSIDLMERIAGESADRIRLSQRGYALATRRDDVEILAGCTSADVDLISNRGKIRRMFPAFDDEIRHVVHVRRAGDLDSHQLSQYLLEHFRTQGGRILRGTIAGIEHSDRHELTFFDDHSIKCDQLVVAAGPFVNHLLAYFDETLPVRNILQQKLAFEDELDAIPREQPFAVDLDPQRIDWTHAERAALAEDEQYHFLTDVMPGGIHRRPEGSAHRRWLKLGWAYNTTACEPDWSPVLDEHFPEIVLRAAARLNPSLKEYYARLPAARSHFGGYYTMTDENLPIIGPLQTEGTFVVAALSGFGTMAACAAGELCASWVSGTRLPDYASRLSLQRYDDPDFMTGISLLKDRGVL
jgi:glycine/D-amino acid oxidase-like deaminating enzyme